MIYDHPLVDTVYRHSPIFGQHALVSVYGLLQVRERRSAAHRRYAAELEASQWHSPEQIQRTQEQRLAALIDHAYANVPFYRRAFDERKLKPADVRTPDELYKLPLLTKEVIRQNYADLRARNIPATHTTQGKTGGTTGKPLNFLLDKERVIFDHALVERHWAWAGYRPGDRLAAMRYGLPFLSVPAARVFWRRDWVNQRLYLSPFQLSRETMPRYIDLLRKEGVQFLIGFPSSMFALARYLESHDIQLPLRAVLTSSEVLTPLERQVIERQFACKVRERYGMGERLVVAQQCEHGGLHQSAEFGVLQADWPLGRPAPTGATGELVHTGLTNFSMPLIRYVSGDLGCVLSERCACGRGLPLMGQVEGRKHGVLVLADGRLMPPVGLERMNFAVDSVERCQLVQKKMGEIIVRVQPRPGFDEAAAAEMVRQLRRRVGRDPDIRVELVDQLEVTVRGKSRFIMSEVDINQVSGLPLRIEQA